MTDDTGERVLDVRDIDGPPFEPIMATLSDLEDGERLVLVSGFEPAPLYGVLEGSGFVYETAHADGEWRVSIERE